MTWVVTVMWVFFCSCCLVYNFVPLSIERSMHLYRVYILRKCVNTVARWYNRKTYFSKRSKISTLWQFWWGGASAYFTLGVAIKHCLVLPKWYEGSKTFCLRWCPPSGQRNRWESMRVWMIMGLAKWKDGYIGEWKRFHSVSYSYICILNFEFVMWGNATCTLSVLFLSQCDISTLLEYLLCALHVFCSSWQSSKTCAYDIFIVVSLRRFNL